MFQTDCLPLVHLPMPGVPSSWGKAELCWVLGMSLHRGNTSILITCWRVVLQLLSVPNSAQEVAKALGAWSSFLWAQLGEGITDAMDI